jgi:RND family efflux transporter MFP subunit
MDTTLIIRRLSLAVLMGCSAFFCDAADAQSAPQGITQAMGEVKLSMTVPGRVDSILVREGMRVKKGDLLLHLDRSLEELEVKRREVMLEDAAKLEELRIREKMLTEQVAQARTLLESGGVSRKLVEDEELALQAVSAERKVLEYAKRREKVELDLAREAYERRHMRSPIAGVITKILPRVGESIPPNEPILTVVDISRVRFNGTFPASSATKLRAGNMVTIRLQQEGKTLTRQARVSFVSPVADPSSGLVELIAEFDNPDGAVRPGMVGQIVAVAGMR